MSSVPENAGESVCLRARSELPFGGWILLNWDDRVSVDTAPPSLRLAALASNRGLTAPGVATDGLLDLLSFPMFQFARPRDWAQIDTAMSKLLESLTVFTS